MFGEPAWDMLLAFYTLDFSGPRQTVGSVTRKSGAPPTSALRWLHFLENHSLVVLTPHPTDARSFHVALTDKARTAVEDYLTFISEQTDAA